MSHAAVSAGGSTFVIKLGGGLLADPEVLDDLASQVAHFSAAGLRMVLVHGGGPQATVLSRRLGLEPRIVAGRRITTPEVLEVATMVFAGSLNTTLVSALRKHGVKAVGLSGVSAGLITARRRPPVEVRDDDGTLRLVDFGHVGDPIAVDPALLTTLLDQGHVPVLSSLAGDPEGRPLNVNADTVAEHIARALGADRLLLLTGSPGVLLDPADPSSTLPALTPELAAELEGAGILSAGMRPKITAALRFVIGQAEAGQGGVAHILQGDRPGGLLQGLSSGFREGTTLLRAAAPVASSASFVPGP